MCQHHLHTMLGAAPGLGAFSWCRVTLQQCDERQHVRECGIAQREPICRKDMHTLEGAQKLKGSIWAP